jgi:hypothetical protein
MRATVYLSHLGIHHITTATYHPQSNGMMERTNRKLKDALSSCLAGNRWVLHLSWVLLGLRAVPKDDGNIFLVELVFGCPSDGPGTVSRNYGATSSSIPEGSSGCVA